MNLLTLRGNQIADASVITYEEGVIKHEEGAINCAPTGIEVNGGTRMVRFRNFKRGRQTGLSSLIALLTMTFTLSPFPPMLSS